LPTLKALFYSFFANATHPESGILNKGNIYFLVCFMPLLPVKQGQSLRQQGASHLFYWGNLPMPQTPLDTHFL
jgi:hypothetical protein